VNVAVRAQRGSEHLHRRGAVVRIKNDRAAARAVSGTLRAHQGDNVDGIDGALPVVACRIIQNADDSVGGAGLVGRVEDVVKRVKSKLYGNKSTGLNEADAGTLDVVEFSDSGRRLRQIRIVDFRIDAA